MRATFGFALTFAIAVTIAGFVTAAGIPTRVQYINHQKAAATFAKPADNPESALISDERFEVLANRQDAGAPEQHDNKSHTFIIVEGEATFVTGGTIVGPKRNRPDRIVGTSIDGGQSHHLTKGDVITIPARTPHWWKEVPTKTIAYTAVNIEN